MFIINQTEEYVRSYLVNYWITKNKEWQIEEGTIGFFPEYASNLDELYSETELSEFQIETYVKLVKSLKMEE